MSNYVVGGIYYMVWYADDRKLYLTPDSLVFVGKNLEQLSNDRDTWYFQDAHSYWTKGRFSTDAKPIMDTPDGHVYCLHEEELYQIVDIEGLETELEQCKKRWELMK